MSPITELLKKDISFKRKPSAKTEAKASKTDAPTPEATAPTQEKKPKTATPKRNLSLPKRAPKPKKITATGSNGRHKQVVGLSIGAAQLAAAVVVNNGRPKLVKAARHTLPPEVVARG